MRSSIFLSALCGTSVLGFSLHGHPRHLQHKREKVTVSTTTIGDTVVVLDTVDVEVTLSPGQPIPTPPAVNEDIALPNQGVENKHVVNKKPQSTASPTTSSSSSQTTPVQKAPSQQQQPAAAHNTQSTSPSSSAAPVADGQTSGVVATISSITAPTASVIGGNPQVGSVCTADVPQLPTPYADTAIHHHNVHRANHSAGNVVWDNELATYAASWASYCNFSHNMFFGDGGYGQNIAAGRPISDIALSISDDWYNGEVESFASSDSYGQANPSNDFESWGHFSQMVWSGTKKVGCASIDCGSCGLWMNDNNAFAPDDMGKYMTVCNYQEAGNMQGQYANNVNKPLGQPTVSGTSFDT